jgi:type I restriction enzyme S subunit
MKEIATAQMAHLVLPDLLVTEELLKQFDNAVMPASFCKLARPAKREYSRFLFLFLRFLRNIRGTEVFEIRSASNIVNYNWTAFLKFQKVKKPNDDVLDKFNAIVEPIYKQIYILGNQNQYLKESRDILLPRLMTGMIDVEKICVMNNANNRE